MFPTLRIKLIHLPLLGSCSKLNSRTRSSQRIPHLFGLQPSIEISSMQSSSKTGVWSLYTRHLKMASLRLLSTHMWMAIVQLSLLWNLKLIIVFSADTLLFLGTPRLTLLIGNSIQMPKYSHWRMKKFTMRHQMSLWLNKIRRMDQLLGTFIWEMDLITQTQALICWELHSE